MSEINEEEDIISGIGYNDFRKVLFPDFLCRYNGVFATYYFIPKIYRKKIIAVVTISDNTSKQVITSRLSIVYSLVKS